MINNFRLLMRERGKIVPGSIREGHNTWTSYGSWILTKLMAWSSIANPDIPVSDRRVRWLGVGGGSYPKVSTVNKLASPLEITTAPSVYIAPVSVTHLTSFSARFSKEFTSSELSISGPVVVSEAGLFMDVSPGLTHSTSDGDNNPSLYMAFDPVVKAPGFTLEIKWDLNF